MPRRPATTKKTATAAVTVNHGPKARRRDAEVLDVAAEIFYERGYASATVQDVADALGMLKGSLYYYIEGKEDLLYRMMSEIHDGVDAVLTGVSATEGLSAGERLDLYIRRIVEYNARNLKKISVYYHDIDQLGDVRRKEILARRRSHDGQITKLIREAQANGEAAPDLDAKLVTNCMFGTVAWMYRWYRPGRGVSIENLGEVFVRFIRYGITGSPTARSR